MICPQYRKINNGNEIIGTKNIKNAKMEKQHEFKIEYYKDNNINIKFGIMQEECSQVLRKFFKTLRCNQ